MSCRCKSAKVIKRKAHVADHLVHLRELWNDPLRLQTLYQCPETGAQWLRHFTGLYFGGEPAILRRLPLEPAFSYYVRGQVELACRCLAISGLSGNAAAEYAQFHLEKTIKDVNGCKIEFRCPVTNLHWIMEFSSSRIPCGGIPVLSKVAQ